MIKKKFLNLLEKVDLISQILYVYFLLPEKIIDMIRNNKISQGHAKVLVGLRKCILLTEKIIKKKIICKTNRKFS